MGIPYEEVVGTGTIATLKGKKDHPVIGLRCDIDALPIKEVKELPYRSENDGVMHACGHDGHISMLLTAAKVLSDHRDELNCTVKLIFQPAEEKTNGALKMLETGRVGHLDTVVVMHIFPFSFRNHPAQIYLGTFMNITIKGRTVMEQCFIMRWIRIYVGAKELDALQSIASIY